MEYGTIRLSDLTGKNIVNIYDGVRLGVIYEPNLSVGLSSFIWADATALPECGQKKTVCKFPGKRCIKSGRRL